MTDTTPALVVDFGAPFDEDDADIILRSSDGKDFLFFTTFLAKASPVFAGILPQLNPVIFSADISSHGVTLSHHADSRRPSGRLGLKESSSVLRYVLSAIYPVTIPPLASFEEALPVLAAAKAYQMYSSLDAIRSRLASEGVGVDPSNCIKTYHSAWSYDLEPEMLAAARASLERPMAIEDCGQDLWACSGQSLAALIKHRRVVGTNLQIAVGAFRASAVHKLSTLWRRYDRICTQLVAGFPRTPLWFDNFLKSAERDAASFTQFGLYQAFTEHRREQRSCLLCHDLPSGSLQQIWVTLDREVRDRLPQSRPTSFQAMPAKLAAFIVKDYGKPYNAGDADVILRSSELVDFHVHKALLALSSPLFRTMFTLDQAPGASLPVVDMAENTKTIAALLDFIYPSSPICAPISFVLIERLFEATHKYAMDGIFATLRSFLCAHYDNRSAIAENPFRAYALACKYGLKDEALRAARLTLNGDMSFKAYEQDLDALASGASLHRLSVYRGRCRTVTAVCMDYAATGKSASSRVWTSSATAAASLVPCPGKTGAQSQSMLARFLGVRVAWWVAYLNDLARRVRTGEIAPGETVAFDEESFLEVFRKHAFEPGQPKCEKCVDLYAMGADKFCKLLQSEIRAAIDKVELEF
ncbi:hypothetical protein FA95DRAFT_1566498 [Auriscalpium vulgare]|uniref:Uncharacterized protein n=1 Tax=Auriscalpium vulgare TaxID=40419 RepID=A0ACB8R8P6_9AGAM|nr:hypothetical protein FA95DRAFT_1566498 [Auriscalpium vulgare]